MYRMKQANTKREKLENKIAKVYTTDAIGYAYAYRR
jgi:hypothetical protein